MAAKVFFDSNLWIYMFEDNGELTERVIALRRRMAERGDRLFTSSLTVGEIMVKPLRSGNHSLAARYQRALRGNATILDFSVESAPHFARIRAGGGIRPADAVQLACAATAGTDLFITNDERLSRLVVPGVQFIQSLTRAFL